MKSRKTPQYFHHDRRLDLSIARQWLDGQLCDYEFEWPLPRSTALPPVTLEDLNSSQSPFLKCFIMK